MQEKTSENLADIYLVAGGVPEKPLVTMNADFSTSPEVEEFGMEFLCGHKFGEPIGLDTFSMVPRGLFDHFTCVLRSFLSVGFHKKEMMKYHLDFGP